ncbi:protein FAM177B [Sarcophilus harrisii]|uniref:protein FAM177B n=1 Tax=Sarcophilus harrisii TaxID=9305 RepID=UPI001301DE0C|nr:protein FAM177B [Sarcophilus harrisii]
MENSGEILQEGGLQLSQLEKKETIKRTIPKRIIHFANGDTMEEYSTEEEGEDEKELKNIPTLVTSKLPWVPYLRFLALQMASTTLSICDFLGEKLATFFGLDEPKYQYLLNDHNKTENQENEKQDEEKDSKVQSTEIFDEQKHLDIHGKQYGTSEQKIMVDYGS